MHLNFWGSLVGTKGALLIIVTLTYRNPVIKYPGPQIWRIWRLRGIGSCHLSRRADLILNSHRVPLTQYSLPSRTNTIMTRVQVCPSNRRNSASSPKKLPAPPLERGKHGLHVTSSPFCSKHLEEYSIPHYFLNRFIHICH